MDDEATLEVCPRLTLAFDILGKRWSALILDVLSHRPARFSEINNAVPRLSERVLSARLTELADAGLVERIQDGSGAHHYELTTTGDRLRPALDAIRMWANDLHSARASRESVRPTIEPRSKGPART